MRLTTEQVERLVDDLEQRVADELGIDDELGFSLLQESSGIADVFNGLTDIDV